MKIEIDTTQGSSLIDLEPFKKDLEIVIDLELEDDDGIFSMFCSGYNDVFMRDYIGYWAYGVQYFPEDHAWLCIEDEGEFRITDEIADLAVAKYKEYRKKNWEGLEPGKKSWFIEVSVNNQTEKIMCFVTDPHFACRAVAAAYKKWGRDSIDNWDAITVDFGAQMALYGQIKWG